MKTKCKNERIPPRPKKLKSLLRGTSPPLESCWGYVGGRTASCISARNKHMNKCYFYPGNFVTWRRSFQVQMSLFVPPPPTIGESLAESISACPPVPARPLKSLLTPFCSLTDNNYLCCANKHRNLPDVKRRRCPVRGTSADCCAALRMTRSTGRSQQ